MLKVFWLFSLIPTFFLVSATTVYLHRASTHGAVKFTPGARWFFKFCIWFTGGPDEAEWDAGHRVHHLFSDKDGDPHSPYNEGFPEIQIGNVIYYIRWIRKHPELVERYSRDVRKRYGWWDHHVFKYHMLGIVLGTSSLCVVNGLYFHSVQIGLLGGLVGALLHFLTYVFLLTPSINGWCHFPITWLGNYQHLFLKDGQWVSVEHAAKTFNNWVIAFLTGGEGLHYNHHWRRFSARFARTRLELLADWGYWLWIVPMKWAGRAYDVKVAEWKFA